MAQRSKRSRAGAVGLVALTTTAACTAGAIVSSDAAAAVRFALLVAAFVSFATLFLAPVRAAVLTRGRVAVVGVALLLLAVLVAPAGHDIWSYAMYGRIVAVHDASPYTSVPADYPRDPLLPLVGWRRAPSVYGPAFVGVAAVGAAFAGGSKLANRLFLQGIEALALAAASVLVWRRTRQPAAVAFVALNPALLLAVADGHNDILVGLAVLSGALLVADGRVRAAGVVLAAGTLVKVVVLLPLAALVVWAWLRWGRLKALIMAAVAAVLVVGAYAVAGGTAALDPVIHAAGVRTSRSSIWGVSGLAGAQHGPLPLVVLAGGAIVIVALGRRSVSSAWLAGAVVLVFLLLAQYVLPWYVAWELPVLALVWHSRLAWLAALQAALLALAYVPMRGTGGVWRAYYSSVVPACSVAVLIVLIVLARSQSAPPDPASASGGDRGTVASGVAD